MDSQAPINTIGLALSGGGFRATLFHLGVVSYLRDRDLLKKVAFICSVSGGSVLAAHLILNWDRYALGNNKDFKVVVKEIVDFICSRDVSGRIARRSLLRLFSFHPMSSTMLANEYQPLLWRKPYEVVNTEEEKSKEQLQDFEVTGIERWDQIPVDWPKLYVMATHVETGNRCSFSKDGFRITGGSDTEAIRSLFDKDTATSERIARSVAASSAFPPLFDPLPPLEGKIKSLDTLTDGGVLDNSGVLQLLEFYDVVDEPSTHLAIVSDAGREFSREFGKSNRSLLDLATRVTDSQSNRISEIDRGVARTRLFEKKIRLLECRISQRNKSLGDLLSHHSTRVQELLATIRTDLNRFSREEAFVLYQHGYRIAELKFAALVEGDEMSVTKKIWDPVYFPKAPPISAVLERRLKRSQDTAYIRKLVSRHDLCGSMRSLGILFVTTCLIASIATVLILFVKGLLFGPPIPVDIAGDLPVVEQCDTVDFDGIPVLYAFKRVEMVGDTRILLAAKSAEIGTLSNQRPYTSSAIAVDIKPPLERYWLVLESGRFSDRGHLSLLTTYRGKHWLPSGKSTDRLLVLLVVSSDEPIPTFEEVQNSISISLETMYEAPHAP